MSAVTHVTEWGLGRLVLGKSSPKTMKAWKGEEWKALLAEPLLTPKS